MHFFLRLLLPLLVAFAVVAEDETECVDLDNRCGDWESMGECVRNSDIRLTQCRRSCGVCGNGGNNDGNMNVNDDDEDDNDLPEDVYMARGADMGKAQILVRQDVNDARPQDLGWMIAKARSYMTHLVPTKHGDDMPELCRNYHRECAYWAWKGQCEQNPEYMRVRCAPMCQSCQDLTLESRCPLDPNEPDAWGPGDLNRLFERWISEPNLSNYSMQVLSSPATDGPWVITLEDFVTEQEAKRLIDLGHQMGYKRSKDVGKRRADGTYTKKVSVGRTSTNAWCIDVCAEDPIVQQVSQRLSQLTATPPKNSEHLQLLRYDVGEYYNSHHDMIEHQVTKQAGPRILTVYIYLNDVEEGGGTHFEKLDVTVMPKRGRLLIWPSVHDSNPNTKDWRTMHEALPVEKGIKFGANAWIHLRDYQTPNDKGCMA